MLMFYQSIFLEILNFFFQRAYECISWRVFRGLCLYSINLAGDNGCCRDDIAGMCISCNIQLQEIY